jgi:hypothetical protein
MMIIILGVLLMKMKHYASAVSALALASSCSGMKEVSAPQHSEAIQTLQQLVATNPYAQAAVLKELGTGKIKKSPSVESMAALLRTQLEQQGIKVGTPFDTFMNFYCDGNYEEALSTWQRLKTGIDEKEVPTQMKLALAETMLGAGNLYDGFSLVAENIPQEKNQLTAQALSKKPHATVVWAKQGIGDTGFYMRYLMELKQQSSGKIIVVARPPELCFLNVLKAQGVVDEVVKAGDVNSGKVQLPTDACQADFRHLPALLSKHGLQATKSIKDVPGIDAEYLQPDAQRVAYWDQELASVKGPIVVAGWSASAKAPTLTSRVLDRKFPIGDALAKFAGSGATVFGVEFGYEQLSSQELAKLQASGDAVKRNLDTRDVIDSVPQDCTFKSLSKLDFMELIALAKAAEKRGGLMVFADSGPVNLLGAAHIKNVITCLPKEADWRWGAHNSQWSEYYPTLELLWQQKQGDWTPVLNEVAKRVHTMAGKQYSPRKDANEQKSFFAGLFSK